MESEDRWIIKPFNKVYWMLNIIFLAILLIVTLAFRGYDVPFKNRVMLVACAINMAVFLIYKIFLSRDEDYNQALADRGGFTWWNEMPLQMCNVNMLLLPAAVWLDNRYLMGFCFMVGPLGAYSAIMMPGIGFSDVSIKRPAILGFYLTHFLVVIEGVMFGTLGLYLPEFSDIIPVVIVGFLTSLFAFLVNMTLRITKIHPWCNYFFNVETEGNAVFDKMYKWLPVPFLYQLPCYIIAAAWMLAVTAFCQLLKMIFH